MKIISLPAQQNGRRQAISTKITAHIIRFITDTISMITIKIIDIELLIMMVRII